MSFASDKQRSFETSKTCRMVVGGLVTLACAIFTTYAMAVTYKWTEANGRIVYSDQPPTSTSIKYEIVNGPPPPADPNAVKDLAAKELEFKKRQQDAADKGKKAETLRAEAAKRVEQCQRAQASIKQLAAEQVAMVRYNEKGEMVYVDDAVRRKERADLEAWMRTNCS